jgi:glycerate kinase
MKIVIAPNSFKNSLDALSAARAMERGFSSSKLKPECLLFPIADGGDHTVDILNRWFGGKLMSTPVSDPLGRGTNAVWSLVRNGKTAVIEMAKASGLALLRREERNPLVTNSYGTGQLVRAALDEGVEEIILGIGGSATVDAGLGMMMALGIMLRDETGGVSGRKGNPLLKLQAIDPVGLDERLNRVKIKVMCDVDNPLLGPDGAAAVFGPQKGASEKDVKVLEQSMVRFNEILKKMTGHDYGDMPCGGAAGGIAVSLKAFLNAEMVNGTDYLLGLMGFDDVMRGAGLLVTAEGGADSQTLAGKGPGRVAQKAMKAGVPVVLLTGRIKDEMKLNKLFDAVFPIANGAVSLERALENTAADLERTCRQLGNLLALYVK